MKKNFIYSIAFMFLTVTGAFALMAETFEDTIYFRDNQASFNSRYEAKTQNGTIWVKEKDPQGEPASWVQLELPDGLAGDVTELAMDDEHIIALNGERQIYTMWNGLDEISDFTWQKEWGIPF